MPKWWTIVPVLTWRKYAKLLSKTCQKRRLSCCQLKFMSLGQNQGFMLQSYSYYGLIKKKNYEFCLSVLVSESGAGGPFFLAIPCKKMRYWRQPPVFGWTSRITMLKKTMLYIHSIGKSKVLINSSLNQPFVNL